MVQHLTFTGGVEQRRLEAGRMCITESLLHGDLDAEAGVRVDVRQRQQVRRAHEEVTMERVHRQTPGGQTGKLSFRAVTKGDRAGAKR